ncbi:MAG: phytoene desaturase [Spirochaetales bacterium]|nr:phytoene desaturase [Spirochaetales bacterium]
MARVKNIVVVGGGFAGLSTAAYLSKQGFGVTLVEKNSDIGGRARIWKEKDYVFDMGPSWYLMPEVFDAFFEELGLRREDYYKTSKLDTSYRVFFEGKSSVDVSADLEKTKAVFDTFEPDGGKKLEKYLSQAEYKYKIAMGEFLYKEYKSIFDFMNKRMMTEGLKLNVFQSLDAFVRKTFSSTEARQILEYAMVFLGSSPSNAPALYSLMSHVDMNLGVYFPEGGLGGVALAMEKAAKDLGVQVLKDWEVTGYQYNGDTIIAVHGKNETLTCDGVVFTGDYQFNEVSLLTSKHRSISEKKWNSMTVAPSMYIMYLGINKKLENLEHHNLYFSHDWDTHFDTIFKKPSWPENPCFYLSCVSKTSDGFAPPGKENVFILVPVAPGLQDTDENRNNYRNQILGHIAATTGEDLRPHIEVERIFTHRDFSRDYNAFKGTALGISHTLNQTAIFRPSFKSKKVPNLYYSGQYTHPGVGVPMVLIASKLVSEKVGRELL